MRGVCVGSRDYTLKMASGTRGRDFVDTISPESYQCAICSKPFKEPRILPCLHSFCSNCLQEYIARSHHDNGKKGLSCPECKRQVIETEFDTVDGKLWDIEVFPVNTFLQGLSKTVDSLKNKSSCDICTRKNHGEMRLNSGKHWCIDCYDMLCDSCADVHKHASSTGDHSTVKLSEATNTPLEFLLSRKRDVKCPYHTNDVIKMFCLQCRVGACIHCVSEIHRRCARPLPVIDAWGELEAEFKDCLGKLNICGGILATNNVKVKESRRCLNENIEAISDKIKQFTIILCDQVKSKEKELLGKLDDFKNKESDQISAEGDRLKDDCEQLGKDIDRIQLLVSYGSKEELLFNLEPLKRKTEDLETMTERHMQNATLTPSVHFLPNKPLKEVMDASDFMGQLTVTHGHGYVEGVSTYADWGVACISSEELIVADGTNKVIQKFRRGGKLVDEVNLHDEPRDVTVIEVGEIAVPLRKQSILVFSSSGKLRLGKTIPTHKAYNSVASFGPNKLVASHTGKVSCVDIISYNGDVLKSFHYDNNGSSLFRDPRYVRSTPEGLILVTDFRQHSLFCLTSDGAVKFKSTPSQHGGSFLPLGLCTDKTGNYFVVDYINNRIVQMNSDGTFQRYILDETNELDRPVAIDISDRGRLVILQNDGMAKIFCY